MLWCMRRRNGNAMQSYSRAYENIFIPSAHVSEVWIVRLSTLCTTYYHYYYYFGGFLCSLEDERPAPDTMSPCIERKKNASSRHAAILAHMFSARECTRFRESTIKLIAAKQKKWSSQWKWTILVAIANRKWILAKNSSVLPQIHVSVVNAKSLEYTLVWFETAENGQLRLFFKMKREEEIIIISYIPMPRQGNRKLISHVRQSVYFIEPNAVNPFVACGNWSQHQRCTIYIFFPRATKTVATKTWRGCWPITTVEYLLRFGLHVARAPCTLLLTTAINNSVTLNLWS